MCCVLLNNIYTRDNDTFRAFGGIRTHIIQILNLLPLPVGLRKQKGRLVMTFHRTFQQNKPTLVMSLTGFEPISSRALSN